MAYSWSVTFYSWSVNRPGLELRSSGLSKILSLLLSVLTVAWCSIATATVGLWQLWAPWLTLWLW